MHNRGFVAISQIRPLFTDLHTEEINELVSLLPFSFCFCFPSTLSCCGLCRILKTSDNNLASLGTNCSVPFPSHAQSSGLIEQKHSRTGTGKHFISSCWYPRQRTGRQTVSQQGVWSKHILPQNAWTAWKTRSQPFSTSTLSLSRRIGLLAT